MGVIYSRISNQVKRINVENRALRAIDRKKPVFSPRHPTSEKYYKEVVEATPEVAAELNKKDIQLNAYLRDVYVTSIDTVPEVVRDKSSLPTDRRCVEDFEMGFWEPSEVPPGFCTIRQALQFLTDHQTNPKLWDSEAIAKKYQLDKNTVDDILEHFKPFNLYLPPKNAEDKFGVIYMKSFSKDMQTAIGGKDVTGEKKGEQKES